MTNSDAEIVMEYNCKEEGEGEILGCLNTILPVSHQNMIVFFSQKGSLFMHDLRCKTEPLHE